MDCLRHLVVPRSILRICRTDSIRKVSSVPRSSQSWGLGTQRYVSMALTFVVMMSCCVALAAAQLPNSGQTRVEALSTPPLSTLAPQLWRLLAGHATLAISSETAPDASAVMEVRITKDKGVSVANTLAREGTLQDYSSFSFWIRTTSTRTSQFVFLVDNKGARRWFPLTLKAEWGWQRQTYLLSSFTGQDVDFDLLHITAIRFHQADMVAGDKLFIGRAEFEPGAGAFLDRGESALSWYVDIGGEGSTLTTSFDSVAGKFSVLAILTGRGGTYSQVDIATRTVAKGVKWDLSRKKYLSFYYKDSEGLASHYCLVYDSAGFYRQWVFDNSQHIGEWVLVTVELDDTSYVESGSVNLSQIVMFEVGIFGLPVGDTSIHVFQVDEVVAH